MLSLVLLLVAAAAGQQDFHRVVMVMRHCVRSTYQDFSDEPYPFVRLHDLCSTNSIQKNETKPFNEYHVLLIASDAIDQ